MRASISVFGLFSFCSASAARSASPPVIHGAVYRTQDKQTNPLRFPWPGTGAFSLPLNAMTNLQTQCRTLLPVPPKCIAPPLDPFVAAGDLPLERGTMVPVINRKRKTMRAHAHRFPFSVFFSFCTVYAARSAFPVGIHVTDYNIPLDLLLRCRSSQRQKQSQACPSGHNPPQRFEPRPVSVYNG